MAAIRSKQALQLGEFFRCTVNVIGAIDGDDDGDTRTVCAGVVSESSASAHKPTPVKQSLSCPDCGNDARHTFRKAVEGAAGWELISQDKLDAAGAIDPALQKSIDLNVHKAESLVGSTLAGGKTYFLQPIKGEETVYALFHALVSTSPEYAFVAVWAARSKPARYRLGTYGSAVTLEQIAWPEAIRQAPAPSAPLSEANLNLARMIAAAAVTEYSPANYVDLRKVNVLAVVSEALGMAAPAPSLDEDAAGMAAARIKAMLTTGLAAVAMPDKPKRVRKAAPRKPKTPALAPVTTLPTPVRTSRNRRAASPAA